MRKDLESLSGVMRPRDEIYLLALIFLLLAFVKLVLVANHEIVASYSPYDSFWHIRTAEDWVWGQPYSEWTLMHLPVYSLFIAITGTIGLPLRIAIELCYIAGAAVVSFAFGRLGLSASLQILSFVLIVFHPYSYPSFDHALAELLYVCQMLFFVGFFIRLIVPKSRSDLLWSASLFAFTAALMWYCRKESVLIAGLFALTALAVAGALAFKFVEKATAARLGLTLVIAPLGAVVLVGTLISAANGLRYGLWQTNQMTAPNYTRAYQSLQAIRPDHLIRFVPVSREVRLKAYAVSPAFRELQPFLDGEKENWGAWETRSAMGIGGREIGAGWFYWILVDAAARAGHFNSAQDAEAYFGRVADDITGALNDGRLPSRPMILPFIDPAYALWLPDLPGSVVALARHMHPSTPLNLPDIPQDVPPAIVATFDHVANRRTYASKPPHYMARGWVLSSVSEPASIQIVEVNGQQVQTLFQAQARPDVPVVAGPSGRPGPPALGFVVEWGAANLGPDRVRFKVSLADGKSVLSDPISTLPIGNVVRLPALEGNPAIFLAVDQLEEPLAFIIQESIIRFLNQWYPVALFLFAVVAGGRLTFVLLRGNLRFGVQGMVLLFVLAIIGSRLLFFAILDASAWNGQQTRYLFSIATLVVILPAILFTFGRRPGSSLEGKFQPAPR